MTEIFQENIKNHVILRLKERFGVEFCENDYAILNRKVRKIKPMYGSNKCNCCDFRSITYKGIDIICIFNFKFNMVKTVLNPKVETEELVLGKQYKGLVIKKETYGYKILLDSGYIGVFHESLIKDDIKKDEEYLFKVLSNKIDKKTGKRKIFLQKTNHGGNNPCNTYS